MNPRLIIGDEQQIVIEGLVSLLDADFDVVGTATDGALLLEACRSVKPEAVLTEFDLPGMNGIEVAEALAGDEYRPRVIFLTQQEDTDVAVRAFGAGISGYVMKQATGTELKTAIREVLAGHTFISTCIAQRLVETCLQLPGPPPKSELPPFTARQIDVLRLMAKGKSMKQVGAALGISTRTAEAHKYQMMERQGVRTVAELLRMGMEHGVVDMPSKSGSPFKTTAGPYWKFDHVIASLRDIRKSLESFSAGDERAELLRLSSDALRISERIRQNAQGIRRIAGISRSPPARGS